MFSSFIHNDADRTMKEAGQVELEFYSVQNDNLELHTDDQKAKAKGDRLNQVSSPVVKPVNNEEMKDALENSSSGSSKCGGSNSGVITHSQPELSYNYPDLVGQKQQPQIQLERKEADHLRPLCEESLKMSGIKVSAADFPMIDDDDNDESSAVDVEKSAKETADKIGAKPDLVEAVLVKTENVMVEPMPMPSSVNVVPLSSPKAHSICNNSASYVLKSALKKPNVTSSKKKGLRVSFHDTKVFYIDTDAEANAEPQLLTVHSLDLPLAPTDFRVFIPAYDFLPSVHVPAPISTGYKTNVDRSYTYEDAIISLRNYSQEVNNEDSDGDDEEFVAFNDATNPSAIESTDSPINEKLESQAQNEDVIDTKNIVNEEDKINSLEINNVEKVKSSDVDDSSVRCLTEANLREHEMILMEQDNFIEVIEKSLLNEKGQESEKLVNSSLPSTVIINEKTLSPPLKELMVDISALTPGSNGVVGAHSGISSGADDWQVELSPLNSIPDSETESSTSSQDTIIMMTSEESERNENHIKQSQMNFNQQNKKELVDNNGVSLRVGKENSAAVSVGSQDSDETLKCDNNCLQTNPIRNVDVEGNLIRSKVAYSSASSGAQKTSSQIRQLMERNALKRNLMRYSNTRLKKSGPVNGEVVNDVPPIEKQRQWRSHESLLDTIKKLTLEESRSNENVDVATTNSVERENKEGNKHGHRFSAMQNGFKARSVILNSNDDGNPIAATGVTNGNLSLQDIRSMFNGNGGKSNSEELNQPSLVNLDRDLSKSEPVPGDLRQWKIRSNQWQHVQNNYASLNNHERHTNGNSSYGRSTSFDTLQDPSIVSCSASMVPFLRNGTAKCATLKEQYNNKDFYRVSLSHNYSQSDDHLEMGDEYDYRDDEDVDDLDNEFSDELSQFVKMDSSRIERLRKRYSYSDMDNYDTVKAFNRRSSVRGIKPRFGSTSEILKQMQNQLQPPSITNHRNSHMTWPYPVTNGYISNNNNNSSKNNSEASNYYSPDANARLPVLQEEIYGSTKPYSVRATTSPSNSIYASVVETRLQANGASGRMLNSSGLHNNVGGIVPKQPPPYQPPPSPSKTSSPLTNNGTSPIMPLRIHTKDERGVPEGASSSPKVHTDSVRHYHSSLTQNASINNGIAMAGVTKTTENDGIYVKNDTQANSGVVYYVMQV